MTITADKPLAVSVRDAAAMLGLGKDAVYRQVREGRLHKLPLVGTTAVRITVASIERLIAEADTAAS